VDVLLAHPADQEHLVVHRQPEEDAHQDDRQEADHRLWLVQVDHLFEPTLVEDQRGCPERAADAQQVAQSSLDRHPERAEHHRQQDQRQPHDEDAEGQQRVPQPVGDVDLHGRVAGDPRLDVPALLPVALLGAQPFDQVGGGRVVGAGGRDDLHQAGVGVGVRRRQRDEVDPGHGLDLGLEPVHDLQRIVGFDDRAGDHKRAVVPDPELLGDQVESHPVLGGGFGMPRIRQRQLQVLGRVAQRAEGDQHDRHGDQRPLGDHPDPPGGRASRLAGAGIAGLGTQSLAGEAEEGGQESEGEQHLEPDGDRAEHPHDGQEGQAGQGQSDQGDDDGEAGEDHRGTGGRGRPGGRLLHVHPVGELVAVPGDDEQGVVDADRQAQHDRQHQRGRAHLDHPGGDQDGHHP